eukprot:3005891-Amphidinium_carterae.6
MVGPGFLASPILQCQWNWNHGNKCTTQNWCSTAGTPDCCAYRKVPDEEAVATAQQQDTFLGELPPTLEAQYNFLDAWLTGRKKKIQAERSASWKAYVKDMWERSPKKIYKWIRGTASVWDLSILHENGYALGPDQTAQSELMAWSKLWEPGLTTFPHKQTSASSWATGDLRNVIMHCPLGKARGVDRWSIGELRLLPAQAIEDLATLLKLIEAEGTWAKAIRKMLFTDCGVRCADTTYEPGGPSVPAGAKSLSPCGTRALDETFGLAFDTEASF